VLVVSNQSKAPQTVTFETDELGGKRAGNTASSPEIAPGATGRMTIITRDRVVARRAIPEPVTTQIIRNA